MRRWLLAWAGRITGCLSRIALVASSPCTFILIVQEVNSTSTVIRDAIPSLRIRCDMASPNSYKNRLNPLAVSQRIARACSTMGNKRLSRS
ncbi:hypothetical protein EDB83DRAFT_96020 [Lactarius deliciosus]|nr:hypothetical protein EDB83DRAFT_96020 [Lactarius deliciosus]